MTFAFTLSLRLLLAVASPLQTADDYVFAKPAITNAIKGVVMGDTGDYGMMRYEDLAFLTEAFKELNFTKWYMYSKEDFISRVEYERTNSTPTSVEIKESGIPTDSMSLYVANPDEISNEPRLVFRTNWVEYSLFDMSTNRYAFVTNTIEQVMTNGTVDVWTNAPPRPYYQSNTVVRTSHSNLISYADFCMKDHIVNFSSLEKNYRANELRLLYSKRTITNLYAIVKAMRFAIPSDYDPVVSNNATYYHRWYSSSNPINETNYTVSSTHYSVYCENVHTYGDKQFLDHTTGNWDEARGYPKEDTFIGERTLVYPENLNVTIITPYPDVYSTYMDNTPRVDSAKAFALVTSTYSQSKTSTASGAEDVHESTNMTSKVMIPLGSCQRSQSPVNDRLCFTINVPTSIYKTAAELSGIPYLELNHVPALPPALTPEWLYYFDISRSKSADESAIDYLSSNFVIYLMLELNPKTDL